MGHIAKIQTIRRPGRKPYYSFRTGLKLHHLGTDYGVALKRASELVRDAPPTGRPKSISGLIVAWESEHPHPRNTEFTKPWGLFVGDAAIRDLGPESLKRYARHLLGRSLVPATVRKYVRYATMVCRWAVEEGHLAQIPKRPKLAKGAEHPRDIDTGTLRAAFEDLPDRARALLAFVAGTGCRPSEACRLPWKHVDMRRAVCILPVHKTTGVTGKPRTIYLVPAAIEILDKINGELPLPKEHVFVNRLGKPYKPSGLRSILRRRGINSVYALRHTAAQSWLDQGVPLEDVAKLLGHRDLRTVQVYAQVRDARSRRVAATLVSPLQKPLPVDTPQSASRPKSTSTPKRRPTPGTPRPNPRKRATGTDP